MRRTPTTIAALGLSAMLTLAACGNGEEPSSDPTPKMTSSSTTSTEPTPSDTEPTPPPEIRGTDAKSAEAFVKYYFEVVDQAQSSGDSRPLASLSEPSCGACRVIATKIAEIYQQGGTMQGGRHHLKFRQTRSVGKDALRLVVDVHASAQRISGTDSDLDGAYRAESSQWVVDVKRSEGSWSVVTLALP